MGVGVGGLLGGIAGGLGALYQGYRASKDIQYTDPREATVYTDLRV